MSVIAAFVDGLMRVKRAPWLVIGAWLTTITLALPLTIAVQELMRIHLGDSMVARQAATGVNFDWWNEFLAQTSGVGLAFTPAILGFAAVMKNVSQVADLTGVPLAVEVAVLAHVAVSLFLAGGILDRLARDRAVGAGAFFSACGVYVFRFARLAVMAGVCYWLLFGRYHRWLFEGLYPNLTMNLTVERTAFFVRLALYVAFALPLFYVNMLFDYAKVRAVVEDRRSMIGAVLAAERFIRRQPIAAWALYKTNALLFLIVIAAYYMAAPSATMADVPAFAIGQLYIVLRVVVRLQFAASQTALFQARLAHAGYVARPVAKWPDSPAAAAIGPR